MPKAEAIAAPRKRCFVIAPIEEEGSEARDHSDKVLKHLVKKTLEPEPFNYNVLRADQDERPGTITSQVIRNIIDGDLVVADLTGRNANVFYELTMCHVWQKPTIHLCRAGETLPFDVGQLRVIFFAMGDPDSLEEAQERIRKQVTWLEGGGKIETAIQFVQAVEAFRTGQAKDEKMFDLLSKIGSSLSSIQSEVGYTAKYVESQRQAERFKALFGSKQVPLSALAGLASSSEVFEPPRPPEPSPKGK